MDLFIPNMNQKWAFPAAPKSSGIEDRKKSIWAPLRSSIRGVLARSKCPFLIHVWYVRCLIFFCCLCISGSMSAAQPSTKVIATTAQQVKKPLIGLPNPDGKVRPLIVIDPGHGGDDFGTYSLKPPRYKEKNLNLATAMMLRDILQAKGFRTVMTRSSDTFIELDQRAIFANEQSPALFVSLHYNSAPSKQAEGVEVYYFRSQSDKSRAAQSKLLADLILKMILQQTGAKSRGVKNGNFAVIRKTTMPAVLIEGGFLTNDDEVVKLKDPIYLKKIAQGVALGIERYLKLGVIK